MKTVIQRVSRASVTIDNKNVANILRGMLVLLGIEETDTQEDINWLSNKIINLRIFDDQNGVMNNSLLDNQGDVIVVSQFTLHVSTKKGNRPSYIKAAKPTTSYSLTYMRSRVQIPSSLHFKSRVFYSCRYLQNDVSKS